MRFNEAARHHARNCMDCWPRRDVRLLYRSGEADAFIAEAPELAGCIADGTTRQEALANVEVVITEWIETAQELGRCVPAPRGRLLFA